MRQKILDKIQAVQDSTKRPAVVSYIELYKELGKGCKVVLREMIKAKEISFYHGINDVFVYKEKY